MKKWLFPIFAFLAAIAVSVWSFPHLPDSMAIHFDPSGTPDGWIGKPFGAFMLPLLILIVPAVIFGTARMQPSENERRRTAASIETVSTVIAGIVLSVHLFTVSYNLGYELSVPMFASAIVGIMFIVLGNVMPRLPQKALSYPKLSEKAYRKASRFTGRFMVGAGVALLFLTLLPTGYIFPSFTAIIAAFIAVSFGSMLHYSRER